MMEICDLTKNHGNLMGIYHCPGICDVICFFSMGHLLRRLGKSIIENYMGLVFLVVP